MKQRILNELKRGTQKHIMGDHAAESATKGAHRLALIYFWVPPLHAKRLSLFPFFRTSRNGMQLVAYSLAASGFGYDPNELQYRYTKPCEICRQSKRLDIGKAISLGQRGADIGMKFGR